MTDILIGTAIGLTLALLPVAVTVVRNARERRRISRAAIRELDQMAVESFDSVQRTIAARNACPASATDDSEAVVSEKNA